MLDIVARLRADRGAGNDHWRDVWEAADEIERLRKIEIAAILLSDALYCGFVRCERCGDQEETCNLDHAKELRVALGLDPVLSKIDDSPF